MSRSCIDSQDLQRSQDEGLGEDTPLVQQARSLWSSLYHIRHKCVASKAALLILLWSFLVGLLSGMLLNPDLIAATILPFKDFVTTYI